MKPAARCVVTAGAAVLGAGLVTVTPLTPTAPGIQPPPVQLAADSDFFTLWADVLDRALTNVTNLGTELVTPPVPILQQVVVNQVGFLQDFLANPLDIFKIFGEMWGNLVAGVSAPFAQPDLDNISGIQTVAYHALSGLMSTILPDNPELGQWLLDFSTTSLSGWLIGELGQFLSPWLELYNSIGDMVGSIRDNDWGGMFNDILNIPAHMVDGWLNGYGTIDLTGLVADVDIPVITIRELSIDLPGLLSAGGSIFGSVTADICGVPIILGRCALPITMEGSGSGPLGSLINLTHIVAQALGWDGNGNPIGALADPTTAIGATVEDLGLHDFFQGAVTWLESL